MDSDHKDIDPYDDDPYSNDEPLPELALQLLQAHRENPAADDFIITQGASLDEIDAAYKALRKEGLLEYTNRMIELPEGRRHTFQLTRNGL